MSKAIFYSWDDLPQVDMTPQIKRQVVAGQKMMSVRFLLEKGAIVGEHKHPHEQITHIISGKIEFVVGGQKKVMTAGDVLTIPSNVPHSAVALEETVNIELFSPPREDFLSDTPPDYMQG